MAPTYRDCPLPGPLLLEHIAVTLLTCCRAGLNGFDTPGTPFAPYVTHEDRADALQSGSRVAAQISELSTS